MKKIAYALLLAGVVMVMTGCTSASVNDADTAAATVTAGPEQPSISDASITDAVKEAFQQDELLNSQQIEVNTNEGVVMLAARLASGRAANRAISLAREIPGVQRVVWSRLELAP